MADPGEVCSPLVHHEHRLNINIYIYIEREREGERALVALGVGYTRPLQRRIHNYIKRLFIII
jgi:hypothetical protein